MFEPVYYLGFVVLIVMMGFLRPYSDGENALLALAITLGITLLAILAYRFKFWGLEDRKTVLITPQAIQITNHLDNAKEESEEIVTDGNMCFFMTQIGNLAATPSVAWAKFLGFGYNRPEILNHKLFSNLDRYDGIMILETIKEKFPFYTIYYRDKDR